MATVSAPTLSAPGIGSGLDVKSIVSQLVALEKQPLTQLQTVATDYQTKLSAFGQLKSSISNFQDQVSKLADPKNWDGMTFGSSNSAAVTGSVTAAAQAASFTVQVSQLAQAQATASAVMPSTQAPGAGSLSISLGTWNANVFTPGTAPAVSVTVSATDTLSQIATNINAANAGVSATILHDASGDRLLMSSTATGVAAGFQVQTSGAAGLGALAYNPPATGGMTQTQAALNTQATVNGVAVTSTNNTLVNALPGVNLNFLQVTTGPVNVTVAADTATARTNINNLVQSYNALSLGLASMTKYDAGTKTAGTLQGDATAVGIQNVLRRMLSAAGPTNATFNRLSDVGLEIQLDGTLKVNATKLDTAMGKLGDLKTFFSTPADSSTNQAGGLAVQIQAFTSGMLASDGSLTYKNNSLQAAIDQNTKDQATLNDRITATEARLNAQYSRLDGDLASLNALSTYVNQQVTTWNNTKMG